MPVNLKLVLGSEYPVLSAYMQDRPTFGSRVSAALGPRGSGKTFGSAQRAFMHMCEQKPNAHGVRPTRGMISRHSYTELMSTTVKDFMAVFKDLGELRYSADGPPTWRSRPDLYLEDGSQLQAEAIFQSSGVNNAAERSKGFQLTWAWYNEASGCPSDFFSTSRQSLGRYPSFADGGVQASWHGAMVDTNAFDESHWLFAHLEAPPRGWNWFRQPGGVYDSGRTDARGRKIWLPNPQAENLRYLVGGPQWYMDLCADDTDDRIKVLLANEIGFFVDGLPVHPWYVDSIHCAEEPFEPDPAYPIIAGFDFGRTPAMALGQHLTHVGRRTTFDELTSQNMSASIFAPECKRFIDTKYPGFRVIGYGDPAGDKSGQTVETTPIEMINAAGIPCLPAPSNVVALRRAALSGPGGRLCMDGKPAYLISPRAKMLRKGMMGGYAFRRLRIAGPVPIYTEEPDKTSIFGHIVEADEYGKLGSGEMVAALQPPEAERRRRREQWDEEEGGRAPYDPLGHLA